MSLYIKNISYYYSDKNPGLIDNTGIFYPGLTFILGSNGAGKSTLLKILAGIFSLSTGAIYYHKKRVKPESFNYKRLISYIPAELDLPENMTVMNFLLYVAMIKGIKKEMRIKQIRKSLNLFELQQFQNKKIKNLSYGMKRKLIIVQGLLNKPKIILADEPTRGLDPEERIYCLKILKKLADDTIILLATNIPEAGDGFADQLYILYESNKIYHGTYAKFCRNESLKSAYMKLLQNQSF